MFKTFLITISFFIFFNNTKAEIENSVLAKLPIYDFYNKSYKDLSYEEKKRVDIFGLRVKALNPNIWTVLNVEQTENRHLIPMRNLILIDSEKKDFQLNSFDFDFKFKKVKKRHILSMPHDKYPIIDFFYNFNFKKNSITKTPIKDHAYHIRFSAVPHIKSGLYFRNGMQYLLLKELSSEITTGVDYKIQTTFNQKQINIKINNLEVLNFQTKDEFKGMFGMANDWNPMVITNLNVRGTYNNQQKTYSGLIK